MYQNRTPNWVSQINVISCLYSIISIQSIKNKNTHEHPIAVQLLLFLDHRLCIILRIGFGAHFLAKEVGRCIVSLQKYNGTPLTNDQVKKITQSKVNESAICKMRRKRKQKKKTVPIKYYNIHRTWSRHLNMKSCNKIYKRSQRNGSKKALISGTKCSFTLTVYAKGGLMTMTKEKWSLVLW